MPTICTMAHIAFEDLRAHTSDSTEPKTRGNRPKPEARHSPPRTKTDTASTIRGFPKIGALFGSLYDQDHTILGLFGGPLFVETDIIYSANSKPAALYTSNFRARLPFKMLRSP